MTSLLNPFRMAAAAPAGLAGYATPTVFKDTATLQAYGGAGVWDYPVVAGELIVVSMHAEGNATIINPTTFTLSLGGSAMTRKNSSATTSSAVYPGSAGFWIIAPSTGTLALAADVGVSARACALVARRITGFDATTPLGGSDAPSKLNADAATLTGSAMTTGRAGNVILADACTKAGTITSATSTTLDGMAHDTTGADTISNLGLGFGHKLLSAIGSITPDWTFDVASRMAASVVEINVAP